MKTTASTTTEAELPSVRSEPLLAELRDCDEVFVSGSPVDQHDARELRAKVTITGPTRLLAPLMDALTANVAVTLFKWSYSTI